MRSSGQRKDGWWRRASTVQSLPSTSAESTAPSRMTPLLLDRSAGVKSPHSSPHRCRTLRPALQASQTPPPHTQDTLDHLVAEQTPGGLNEQVPSPDSRRVHRGGYDSLVACDECVLLCLQCVLLCFRRCSASSPKQGRTKPSPTRLTALLRAFSNGKRQSSRKSPTLQRPVEVAIDCSEHRALQTVLRLAGVK